MHMKNLSFIILCLGLFFSLKSFAINKEQNIKESNLINHDTIYITNNKIDSTTIYYQTILEKTNAQLSLWGNPYGLMIGALGVLFTCLTILFAFILFRQSADYKNIINQSITKYQVILDKLIKETQDQTKLFLESNDERFAEKISEYKKELESATLDQKAILEEKVKQLEIQKNNITEKINKITVRPDITYFNNFNTPLFKNSIHKCSKCSREYQIEDYYILGGASTFGSINPLGLTKTTKCPYCDQRDIYLS